MAARMYASCIRRLLRVLAVVWWTAELTQTQDAVEAANATTSLILVANVSDPAVSRRLVGGLQCDLAIYNSFIESEDGQDIFIMAAMCESRIVYIKNARAGWYGPVQQADLQSAMCSDECLRSDELHKQAMSLSRCTCAEVSADTFVRHDFCLESSARLLCTHLSECGHWGCKLEDFNCPRFEWDHLHPCVSTSASLNVAVALLGLLVLGISVT